MQCALLALSVPPGKRALLLFLVGLIVSFGGARVNARLMRARAHWRLRSVWHGDVHVHHVVYGVIIMMISGGLTFALASDSDWRSFLAFVFGAGTGLVLDEFALIMHLEDVYWEETGRKSVDALVLTVSAALMLLFGLLPFSAEAQVWAGPRWFAAVTIAVNLIAVVVAGLKGKVWMAAVGLFVPVLAIIGAITVAQPDSPWARRRYAGRPDVITKAEQHTAVWKARRHRLHDLIGGKPTRHDVAHAPATDEPPPDNSRSISPD